MLTFCGWKIRVENERIIFKKGARGFILPLPKPFDSYTIERKSRKIRLRDFESIFGEEKDQRIFSAHMLTLKFKIGEKEYLVHLVKCGSRVYVIDGYSDWDGDVYGFHIEGLE